MYANDLTSDELLRLIGAEMQGGGVPASLRGWVVTALDAKLLGRAVVTVKHQEYGERRWQITAAALP